MLLFDLQTAASTRDETISQLIHDESIRFKIPAISVSISYPFDSKPRNYTNGYLSLTNKLPINENTLFQIGSITKSYVSAVMLQLEAEGKLQLNDPIQKWLPKTPPSWNKITIRQLLNHTSGIYNYTDIFDATKKQYRANLFLKSYQANDLINLTIKKPLYFKPGTNWHYSNTNYVIAAVIIEAVTKRSIELELNSRIFHPLHLIHTFYNPNLNILDKQLLLAHGYSENDYFIHEPKDTTSFNLTWANAAGSIVATPSDVCIWFRHLFGGSILPERQMQELLQTTPIQNNLPHIANNAHYGLGIFTDKTSFEEESWWHSGGMLGHTAYAVWLKQKDIVLVITTSHLSKERDFYLIAKDIINAL